jgi:hypothetical protein
MFGDRPPAVLAIDDADVYGPVLASLVREIACDAKAPLVLLAVRSGRVDNVLNPTQLDEVPSAELAMPPLCDQDINGLLDVLTRENRLGILTGQSRAEQLRAFRDKAGRQLIVAMIEATSGRPFREKLLDELLELKSEEQFAYALLAVASTFRIDLGRDDVLLACGDRSNAVLNALDKLARRHVITAPLGVSGPMRARHRVIADVLVDELAKTGQLVDALLGLALVAASKIHPRMSGNAKPVRLLRNVINHDFLKRTLGAESARAFYGRIEDLLAGDFHFWLQRGALEVEVGDLDLAQLFLDQATALSGDDPFVDTENAYLMFRRALANPRAVSAPKLVEEATASLQLLIRRRGSVDLRQYHVLGLQGLAWVQADVQSTEDKATYLRGLIAAVDEGCKAHPRSADLQKLRNDLQSALLRLAVPKP